MWCTMMPWCQPHLLQHVLVQEAWGHNGWVASVHRCRERAAQRAAQLREKHAKVVPQAVAAVLLLSLIYHAHTLKYRRKILFWPGKAELDTVSSKSQVLELGYSYWMLAEFLSLWWSSCCPGLAGGGDSRSRSGEFLHWPATVVALGGLREQQQWLCVTVSPLRPAPLSMVSPATAMPSIKHSLSAHPGWAAVSRFCGQKSTYVPRKCSILRVSPDPQDQWFPQKAIDFVCLSRKVPIPNVKRLHLDQYSILRVSPITQSFPQKILHFASFTRPRSVPKIKNFPGKYSIYILEESSRHVRQAWSAILCRVTVFSIAKKNVETNVGGLESTYTSLCFWHACIGHANEYSPACEMPGLFPGKAWFRN